MQCCMATTRLVGTWFNSSIRLLKMGVKYEVEFSLVYMKLKMCMTQAVKLEQLFGLLKYLSNS